MLIWRCLPIRVCAAIIYCMKIAVMTCGGDCAGLNAVVRAVVVRAERGFGWSVSGVRSGFWGLIDQDDDNIVPLTAQYWDKENFVLGRGGTILRTAVRHLPADREELCTIAEKGAEFFRKHKFDGLVVVGGDVSMAKAKAFSAAGIPVVGVAKTIDNDVVSTQCVGFSSAVQVGVDAIDRLRTTAVSHGRLFVVEVMGRDAGFLPLSVAIAGGADMALLPEIPYDTQQVIEEARKRIKRDGHVVIVTSEAAHAVDEEAERFGAKDKQRYRGAAHKLEQVLTQHIDVGVRSVVLGHVQRGGGPTAYDRILACRQGVAAVNALAAGETNVVVGWDGFAAKRISLHDIHVTQLCTGSHLVAVAQGMDIFLGKTL